MDRPLWQPSPARIAASNMKAFMAEAERRSNVELPDYAALWRWSIESPEAFWSLVWDFGGIVAETRGAKVLVDGDKMPGAQFFPDARLNFAENLLRRRDASPAMIFRGEDKVRRTLSQNGIDASLVKLKDAVAKDN